MAEGDLVVERALAAGCEPVAALCRDDRPPDVVRSLPAQVPVYGAGATLRRHVTGLGVALDVVAIFERPTPAGVDELLDTCRRLLVIEAVDNPTNLGALVRNAAGLGWDGLLLDPTSADPLARRALRTSMGTAFLLRWARTAGLADALAQLRSGGVWTAALTPGDGALDLRSVTSVPARVALVVGAERAGITDAVRNACDTSLAIPMAPGVDSLNVASAAAIALHHLAPTGLDRV